MTEQQQAPSTMGGAFKQGVADSFVSRGLVLNPWTIGWFLAKKMFGLAVRLFRALLTPLPLGIIAFVVLLTPGLPQWVAVPAVFIMVWSSYALARWVAHKRGGVLNVTGDTVRQVLSTGGGKAAVAGTVLLPGIVASIGVGNPAVAAIAIVMLSLAVLAGLFMHTPGGVSR